MRPSGCEGPLAGRLPLLALSAQLDWLPRGAAASTAPQDPWNPRDTLLVQRGAVLVSSRLQPPPLSGLYVLGTGPGDLRAAPLAGRAPADVLRTSQSTAPSMRRRRRRTLAANSSQEVMRSVDGALLTVGPAVLFQVNEVFGQPPEMYAGPSGGAARVGGIGANASEARGGAGGGVESDADRHPQELPWERTSQRLAGLVDRVAESVLQLPRRVFGTTARALPRNYSAPWAALSLLQARASVGVNFNPAYLILPLLGLGALAFIVMALFMRFERESSRCDAPPQERPCAQGSLSARSLRSPLPSMRSFVQPATPGRHEPSLGPATARSASMLRLRSEGSLPAREEPDAAPQHLCPSLVVPSGMELIFAVREVMRCERQQLSFCIVSLQGQPLSHVIVNERGRTCGIQLQMLDQRPLATVHTKPVYDYPPGPPEVHRPSGEVYCTISKLAGGEGGQHVYALQRPSGQRVLTIRGSFHDKCMQVVNSAGRLVCDTERCTVDFDSLPHYQVRVAPGVDAGLVLCGLLAVDKVEGGGEAR